MKLKNPENYKGYWCHPTQDNNIYQVLKAEISEPQRHGWVRIQIWFEKDKHFSTHSPSIRGAKQFFAFQCKSGSKWE